MKALIIMFIMATLSVAQASSVKGEGRFYSTEDDSLSFIKNQLLSNAFKDLVTKELKALRLDSELFWKNYEEKFDEAFKPKQEALFKAYGGTEEEDVPANKKVDYKKALRKKKLLMSAKFGRIKTLIKSYSVVNRTRSAQDPNARYMRVRAKVDRKKLNSLFIRFTSEASDRTFQNLYVNSKFELRDLLWSEVGVELERDFTNVVKNGWKKWFFDNLSTKVKQVVFVNEDNREELEKRMKMTRESLNMISNSLAVEKSSEEGESTEEVDEDNLEDSIVLNIDIKISKVSEEELLKKKKFKVEGEYTLVDLKNLKLVDYGDLFPEVIEYNTKDLHQLSSGLATKVFNIALTKFKHFEKKLSNIAKEQKVAHLNLNGVSSIDDVFAFIKELTKRGITKQFSPKLKSYDGKVSKLELSYSGNTNDMKTTLLNMNELKIKTNKEVQIPNEVNPFDIHLKTIKETESI